LVASYIAPAIGGPTSSPAPGVEQSRSISRICSLTWGGKKEQKPSQPGKVLYPIEPSRYYRLLFGDEQTRMKGADEPTGVANDQKHTPKKPYNADMTIWAAAKLGTITVFFGNAYDSGVVADEVPDEQLDKTRH
jgi:hypothetical protein